jgi:predicted PurR-regulated permease PerM
MTMAEFLFVIVLGYGLYKLLRPFQQWLEKMLVNLTSGKKRTKGVTIDVEPEYKKKGS